MQINPEEFCRNVNQAFQIPAAVFNMSGQLVYSCPEFGIRRMDIYLKLADSYTSLAVPSFISKPESPAWIVLPAENRTILIGPVQTGHDPNYIFDDMHEYEEQVLLALAEYFCLEIYGSSMHLHIERIAEAAVIPGSLEYEVDPMPELYESIRAGDIERLNRIVHQASFRSYTSIVMERMQDARTVCQFSLTRCYHIAAECGVSQNELTALITRSQKKAESAHTPAALQSLLVNVMYDHAKLISQMRYHENSPLIRTAKIYISNHVFEQVTVDQIASACAVSRSTLQHRFAEETGITLKQEILNAKVERAKWFLSNTALSCAEISYRLGFSSQSWFISRFSSVCGMTPAAYRKNNS